MSITSLLKLNGMSFPDIERYDRKMDELELHNPDIPGDYAGTKRETNIKNYDKLKNDKGYIIYQGYKFKNYKKKEINGDFLQLGYDKNYGHKQYNQELEGAIDPENMMRRINPLRAQPYDYIQGAEGFDFRTLPSSVYKSHDSTQLISKARSSYASRLVSLGQLPSLEVNNVPVYLYPKNA